MLSHFGGIYKSLVYPASNSSRDGHTSIHQSSSGIFKGAPKGLGPTSYSNAFCVATWLNQIFHRELRLSGEEGEGKRRGKRRKRIFITCILLIFCGQFRKKIQEPPSPSKELNCTPIPWPWWFKDLSGLPGSPRKQETQCPQPSSSSASLPLCTQTPGNSSPPLISTKSR